MGNENKARSHIVYVFLGKSKRSEKDILSRTAALWPLQTGTNFYPRLKATSNNGEYVFFEKKKNPTDLVQKLVMM